MAQSGVSQIDDLLAGRLAGSLGPDNCQPQAAGLIQDLLTGHGFTHLPGILGAAHGRFGPQTSDAAREFQGRHQLPQTGAIDLATLHALIDAQSPRPIACCGYLSLVLDIAFTGMVRVMSLTSQFEGAGLFTAVNANTDKAGLSFGLIQWAQKPGRLHELLVAFQAAQPGPFVQILCAGDPAAAGRLLAHTATTRGGTDETGETTDPQFDLVRDPWKGRFLDAGRDRALQRVQVDTALAAFSKSLTSLRRFAPQIRSERGVAFMLDVANQHGDAGAESIFNKVNTPGMAEPDVLAAVQQESVARVRAQFGEGPEVRSTQNRREVFRTTAILSDEPLVVT
jgi:peptidoglycan hydrolase-like protein with peptidoglycan-binding domain